MKCNTCGSIMPTQKELDKNVDKAGRFCGACLTRLGDLEFTQEEWSPEMYNCRCMSTPVGKY